MSHIIYNVEYNTAYINIKAWRVIKHKANNGKVNGIDFGVV